MRPELLTKPKIIQKEKYRLLSLINTETILNKILMNRIQKYIEELYTMTE